MQHAQIFGKVRPVVFELCKRTQTNGQLNRHIHHNTSHPYGSTPRSIMCIPKQRWNTISSCRPITCIGLQHMAHAWAKFGFYRAMLCIRGTSHGPVSVRVRVRLSQVGVLSKRMNESGWFLAWELHSTYPTLCYKEIHVPSKIKVLLSGTLS